MIKNIVKTFIIVGIVFGLILGGGLMFRLMVAKKIQAKFANIKTTVSTTVVRSENWQPSLQFAGSLKAINGVNVTTEVSGKVTDIDFTSGQLVTQGQVLLQLDDSTDVQDLKNYQAQLTLDKLDFVRKRKLFQQKVIANSQYDMAKAKLEQAQALVKKAKDMINKKKITAPFSGRIGIRQVNLGQYLNPGDKIASLQSLNPLYANFSVPEQYLPQLSFGQSVSIEVRAWPKKQFAGKVTAINSNVTTATRSIEVQASLPNPDLKLYPGNFATITVYLPDQRDVVSIPQTAVVYSLYGDSVYIVKQQKNKNTGKLQLIAKRIFVKLGQRKDNRVSVLSGLKAGDTIVSVGQFKLTDGDPIQVNNTIQLTPRSSESLQRA